MFEKKKQKNRLFIRLNYFFTLILFLHCTFFLVYWLAVSTFRGDVDQFIGNAVGVMLPFTAILMVLSVITGVWTLFRFVGLRLAVRRGEWLPVICDQIFVVVSVLFFILFYAAFLIILKKNPSQGGVIIHLLNLTRLVSDAFLFLLSAVWLRRLIFLLRRKMIGAEHQWVWTVGIISALALLVGLWLVPTLFPPNWAYHGNLPTKPALIAHRGASMLAPENTLASAELASAYQAFGFETDLRISWDGEPFLMHDSTLERTTNIAEVYPERAADLASSFTLDELSALNAGLWFIQKDPFKTISEGLVSQTQLSINQGQQIPTLSEALLLVGREDMVILFDIRYPPEDHPYYDAFFSIVLKLCRESGLNSDIWLLLDDDQRPIVLEEAPQMTRVIGVSSTDLPDAQTLLDLDYEIVNVDVGIRQQDIHDYRNQGLGVNVYTVDEIWLFSQFWLSGVTSLTTNNIHTFSQLNEPFLNLSYSRYVLLWGLYGIIVAIWLAGSQPHPAPEPEGKRRMETPDLLAFAENEDDQFDSRELSLDVSQLGKKDMELADEESEESE
jgi:glycerophosphoryl diester phosphodiesterase